MDIRLMKRARAVFHEVTELPEDERPVAIRDLCGADDALRTAVLQLLRADNEGFEVLDTVPSSGVVRALADAVEHDDTPPETLGSYRVIRTIGKGGMGVVYEAEQDEPRRRVALKRVHPWLHSGRAEARFRAEVQAMADVLHPGIPQVYELFNHEGFLVVAMELVDGPTLDSAAPSLSRRRRLILLRDIALAVSAAHEVGVIHRDLKPANILLDRAGRPKVLDFGIAQRADDLGQSGGLGTLAYVAPEQLDGERVDERADVFALAVISWEILFGNLPFGVEGTSRAQIRAARQQPPTPPNGTRRDLVAVLRRGLELSPDLRTASAADFAAELHRVVKNRRVDALSADPLHPAQAFVRRHRWRLAAGAAIAALTAGTVFGGTLISAEWERRAVERDAAQRLHTTQRLATRYGSEAPETIAAFEALIGDPTLAGTEAVSRGWLWRAEQTPEPRERRSALATAYVLAPDAVVTEARDRLAEHLATQQNWVAVEALRADVPEPLPAGLQRDLDLAHWGAPTQEASLLRRLLGRATPVWPSGAAAARFAPDDPSHWIAEGSVVHQVLGEQSSARWTFADPVIRIEDSSTTPWVITRGKHTNTAYRLMNDGTARPAELPYRSLPAAVEGDADRDGATEVYHAIGYPTRTIKYAEPTFSTPKPLGAVSGALTTARRMRLADLDGDGKDELILALADWQVRELRVLTGVPKTPTVMARFQMEIRDVAVVPNSDPPQLLALGSAIGSAVAGSRLGPSDRLVSLEFTTEGLQQKQSWTLPRPASRLHLADLTGDGVPELLFNTSDEGTLVAHMADPSQAEFLPGLSIEDATQRDGRVLARTAEGAVFELGQGDAPMPRRALTPPEVISTVPAEVAGLDRDRWIRADRLASLRLGDEAGAAFAELGRLPGPVGHQALAQALAALEHSKDAPRARNLSLRVLALRNAPPDLTRSARQMLVDSHHPASLDESSATGLTPGHAKVAETLSSRVLLDFDRRPTSALHLGADGPGRVRWNAPLGALELDGFGETESMEELVGIPVNWNGSTMQFSMELDFVDVSWGAGLQVRLGEEQLLSLSRNGSSSRPHQRFVIKGPSGGGLKLPEGSLEWSGRITITITDSGSGPWISVSADDQGSQTRWRHQGALPAGETELSIGAYGLSGTHPRVHARIRRLELRGMTLRGAAPATVQWRAMVGDPSALAEVAQGPPSLASALAAAQIAGPSSVDFARLSRTDRRHLLRSEPHRWLPLARRLPAGDFADSLLGYRMAAQHEDPALRDVMRSDHLADLDLSNPELWEVATDRAIQLARLGRSLEAEDLMERISTAGGGPDRLWLHLARARFRRGERDGAADAVQALLAAAPDRPVAEDRLRRSDPDLLALVGAGAAPQSLSLR